MTSKGTVNVPIALASLTISLMLWMIVFPQQLSSRTRPFRIKLGHPFPFNDKKFFIVKQQPDIVVHAKVTDQEFKDLIDVATAEVDLSNPHPGTFRYPVSINPPRFQKLIQESIPYATYTLESVVQTKVPVTAVTSGQLSDQSLSVDDLKIQLQEAEISGPKSVVDTVARAQATVRLEMVDPRNPQPLEVILQPFDSTNHVVENVEIHPSQTQVTPRLSLSPKSQTVFVRAKFTGKVPEGYVVKSYSVEPDRITVEGSGRAIEGMTKVFTLPIDISQLTSTQTVTTQLQAAPNMTKFDVSEVKVTIIIEPTEVSNLNPNAPPARRSRPGSAHD